MAPAPNNSPSLSTGLGRNLLGIVRILIGFEFLWAFFDKTFGLGFSTPSAKSWISGGSPVKGFLGKVVDPKTGNPFADFFSFWLQAETLTNVLFMLGLLGVGLTLTFGLAVRAGAIAGAAMMLLMWLASFPIGQNPFLDAHLINVFLLLALAAVGADRWLGLGSIWRRTVKNNPVLI
ncbi:DoxX family membrane protein [Devriesea agamarum]|uniref:DoxX family membrane protein n=1 Tax=Devriesea agamarum TaxID=472569 RepID=UPI00071D1131|nr:DoxX family membrane protein [Devriesea agamarum]